MTLQIKRAVRSQAKLRLALIGPSGSGKTYTALKLAKVLTNGGRILVFDSEHGSASKYANVSDPEVGVLEFDVIDDAPNFSPQTYIEAIHAAEQGGYDVIVLDSLSHAWMGKDGALELVDKAQARQRTPNSYTAWRDVTPLHNAMIDAIVGAKVHVIATMRSKMEYVQEKDANNKTVVRKVGLQPVQRDGMEYEFDVVADLDQDNTLVVGKTRCPAIRGLVVKLPGRTLAEPLREWLSDGAPRAEPSTAPVVATQTADALSANGHVESTSTVEHNPVNAVNRAAVSGIADQLEQVKAIDYAALKNGALDRAKDKLLQLVTATNDQLIKRAMPTIAITKVNETVRAIGIAITLMIDYDAKAPMEEPQPEAE